MSPFEHGEVFVLDDGGEVSTVLVFFVLLNILTLGLVPLCMTSLCGVTMYGVVVPFGAPIP